MHTPRRPRPEQQQHADYRQVVDQLVQKGRVEGRVREVIRRPPLGVDLQPPRQRRRLAEQLLIPPVADPAAPVERAGSGWVRRTIDAVTGAVPVALGVRVARERP